MLRSTIAFGVLLGISIVAAFADLPSWLETIGNVTVYGVLPGWLLLRALAPAAGPARSLGLGICLSPIVVALIGLLVVSTAGWSGLGTTMILLEAGCLVALTIRDRGVPFGGDRAFWLTLTAGAVLAVVIMAPNLASLRARAGTHGLLHAAISESIIERGLPPENPYFAGETVLYYWFYHLSVAPMSEHGDPLLAFALSNLILLLGTLLVLHELAIRLFRIAAAGPIAAAIGFFGLNAFGWIFFFLADRPDSLEQVEAAKPPFFFYRWLASGWDTRVTATLTKFLNVSSNQATVAAGLILLWLGIRAVQSDSEDRRGRWVLAGLATFACSVFEPLVALGFLLPLGAGLVLTGGLSWLRGQRDIALDVLRLLIAIGVGGLLSLIVLWPWMGAALDESNPALEAAGPARHWIGLFATCGLLLALASWSAFPMLRAGRRDVLVVSVFSVVLAAMALGLQAAEDCEYKFLRVLSLPLGLLAAERIAFHWRQGGARRPIVALALALTLIPTNAIAWIAVVAFARGEARFEWTEDGFVRSPVDSPASEILQKIRSETTPETIVLDDPRFYPNNVAGGLHHNEVPIFTRRALFTDDEFYLTDRYEELPARLELCQKLFRVDGQLTQEQIALLRDLGRPVVLLLRERYVARPDGELERQGYDPKMPEALAHQGIFQPAFRAANFLVYRFDPEGGR
ncbi:MAG: hypothetical protein RL885_08540 [Planctomycetota bacterium]